jgi:DNA transposition AAA+ family ATPase
MTLGDAIATLYACENNCGCETFWDGSIKVRIDDIMNRHHSETMFSRGNMGKAGQRRVDEAARLFPKAFQQLRTS